MNILFNTKVSYKRMIKEIRINEKYETDLKKAHEIITRPDSINKMIVMIDMGFSPLIGIIKELEDNVDCTETHVRQVIGGMIKVVLNEFGYEIIKDEDRARIKSIIKPKYFVTASKYKKSNNKEFSLKCNIETI